VTKLILAGLTLISVTVRLLAAQQNPPAATNPLAGDPAAQAEGQRLFGQTCASCHGPSGLGSDRGPALTTLTRGNADADLFRAIRNGIAGTQMPPSPGLTDTQVWQIAVFVRGLQPAVAANRADGATAGNAAAGEAIFRGKADCASCHEVNGRGGIVGPDLSNAGRLTAAVLRQRIVAPNDPALAGRGGGGRGGAAPAAVVVKTQDGREVRGVRRNEDTFSIQMIDATGQLRLFDKLKVSVTVEESSLHPRDYATRLAETEIADLVAYLRSQQGRDVAKTALAPPVPGGVTYERLRNTKAEPHNWLMYWGDYQGTHFSSLKQIDTTNVARLRSAWSAPVPGDTVSESTPLVVDGVMYNTSGGSPRTVTAMDART
jgi:putative heme-binding domain-containing protein